VSANAIDFAVNEPLQLQISNVSYDNFIGRLLIGRVRSGRLLKGVPIGISSGPGEAPRMVKCSQIFKFAAFARQPVDEASAGDIVVAAGIPDFNIGDTLVDLKTPMPLPPIWCP
jgi:GTP-binding protein